MKLPSTTGGRMRYLRLRLGLNQEEMGKKIGSSASALSLYENDISKMGHEKIALFCDYTGVKADWLLCLKPSKTLHARGVTIHA